MKLRTANPKLAAMSSTAAAEIYFIGAMMILILVICSVTMFLFIRQYRREVKSKDRRDVKVEQADPPTEEIQKDHA